jgi:hypothetical protein
VFPPSITSDKFIVTVTSSAMLVQGSTRRLVSFSKLCVCTHSINIMFAYCIFSCWIKLLLLYCLLLSSNHVPRNDHLLRFLFLLLPLFLRHKRAGKTETLTNVMHEVIICMFLLFVLELYLDRICGIIPVLKLWVPPKLKFLVVASNIHLH